MRPIVIVSWAPSSAVFISALIAPVAALAEPVLGVSGLSGPRTRTPVDLRIQAAANVGGVMYTWRCSFSEYLVTQLGTTFDVTIYPVLTTAFGSEPNPGIDGDPRVAILIYDFNDSTHSIDGSFNYQDIAPQGPGPSNYREMFYLNLEAILAEPDNVGALAAHEFAHLILYYREVMLDPSPNPVPEELWVLEGLTSYAEHLAGYDGRTNRLFQSFTNDPSLNLTVWRGVRGNYGASYSFVRYLAEREGPDIIRRLANEPLDGITGIDAALAAVGSDDTFATVFDDWVIAAFLDNRPPVLPPYQFVGLSAYPRTTTLAGPEPLLNSAAVTNYGTLYLDFPAASPEASYQAVVDGADGAPLQAALISWDSAGAVLPSVARFDLANPAGGGTITVLAGHDRHTLAVWARGPEGVDESYDLVYTGAADPPGGVLFLDMGGSDQTFYRYTAVLLERGVIRGKEIPSGSGLWFWSGRDNVTRAQPEDDNTGPGPPHWGDRKRRYPHFQRRTAGIRPVWLSLRLYRGGLRARRRAGLRGWHLRPEQADHPGALGVDDPSGRRCGRQVGARLHRQRESVRGRARDSSLLPGDHDRLQGRYSQRQPRCRRPSLLPPRFGGHAEPRRQDDRRVDRTPGRDWRRRRRSGKLERRGGSGEASGPAGALRAPRSSRVPAGTGWCHRLSL